MQPGAQGAELSRIAIIYMSPSDTSRRVAEDAAVSALAKKLKGAQVASSYRILSANEMSNKDVIGRKLESAGFDGALIMRPAGVSHRVVSDPGAFYPTFTGYWGWAYPMAYEPGYLRTETIVRLDTRLYSLKEDRLLWAGVSNTTDPSSINRLVQDVARSVAKALAKNDLVAGLGSGAAPLASVTR